MRYTSHPPRAFRNRIARYLGVLVAAALIATLGLPGAAQAQSIDPTVEFSDGDRLRGQRGQAERLTTPTGVIDNWIVTFTKPDGTEVVVDRTSDGNHLQIRIGANRRRFHPWLKGFRHSRCG